MATQTPAVIETAHLFSPLDAELIALLRSLTPDDWHKQTLAPLWNVKDVAAHLLDGNIRTITILRDHYQGTKPAIHSYQDLLDFLNGLNADWVKAMKRMSPDLLIDLLESTGREYCALMEASDPQQSAPFSVAWAGEEESKNWFHMARELTEKWHHQQQIREAVGKHGAMQREFLFPVLDCFMRALPHTYRHTPAPDGTTVQIIISTDVWTIMRTPGEWAFASSGDAKPAAAIRSDAETAWKLFTKAMKGPDAMNRASVSGEKYLTDPFFTMIAIMG